MFISTFIIPTSVASATTAIMSATPVIAAITLSSLPSTATHCTRAYGPGLGFRVARSD